MTQARCGGCGSNVRLDRVRIASITRGLVDLRHRRRGVGVCGPIIVAELQANKPARIPRIPAPRVDTAIALVQCYPLREAVREFEMQAIRWALSVAGNQRAAAKLLGTQRTTLNERLRRARLCAAWPEAKSAGVRAAVRLRLRGERSMAIASAPYGQAMNA